MLRKISDVVVECVKGDITSQADITAVVNAANAQLKIGGGVAGAIHKAAGPKLEQECQPLAPIRTGQAVITRGYNLPNNYVIHCLGPVYGLDKPEDVLLSNCYRNVLRLAEERKIESVAFPAISTGYFRYPIEEATDVALRSVIKMIPELHHVKRIRFVLYNQEDLDIYEESLSRALE